MVLQKCAPGRFSAGRGTPRPFKLPLYPVTFLAYRRAAPAGSLRALFVLYRAAGNPFATMGGTVPGEYYRRTQEKVKAGVTGQPTPVRDRGVAGDRPRRFCYCAPVPATGTVPSARSKGVSRRSWLTQKAPGRFSVRAGRASQPMLNTENGQLGSVPKPGFLQQR
jgi:hypothetical protein